MPRTAYEIGKWVAKNKVISIVIALFLVGAIPASCSKAIQTTSPSKQSGLPTPKDPCTDHDLEDRIKMAKDDAKANNHEGVVLLLGRCHTKIAEGTEAHKLLTKASAVVEKKQATEKKRQLAEWKKEGVSIGMTKERVIQSSWGKPEKINSTTSLNGTREQWVYRGHNYLYFQDGILTTIQN